MPLVNGEQGEGGRDRFKGQVAIVSGSTDGIGLAVARELVREGASVVVNGRDAARLDVAVDSIQTLHGGRVHAVCGDVSEPSTIERLVHGALEEFGQIDVLVNNVGGGTDVRAIERIEDDEWQRTLDLNLGTAFALCRAVIPRMKERRYGRVVNISSVAGRHKGRLSGPQYSAAKAAIGGLTRHLAWDLGRDGITVNVVAPGFVMTERALRKWESRTQEEREDMLSQVPLRRFATPEEIARPVLFLASGDASYITGVSLDVNGGSFMC